MKFAILFMAFFAASFSRAEVSACNGNLEAEFIAHYNHVDLSYAEAGNIEHTTFDLKDFTLFQANGNCPLDQETAAQAQITVYRILNGVAPGDQVSGVLVFNPKFNLFSIEN